MTFDQGPERSKKVIHSLMHTFIQQMSIESIPDSEDTAEKKGDIPFWAIGPLLRCRHLLCSTQWLEDWKEEKELP